MVFPPPGIARQDWKIVRALGEYVGVTLPYSEEEEMEERVQTLVPLTLNMDEVSHSKVRGLPTAVVSYVSWGCLSLYTVVPRWIREIRGVFVYRSRFGRALRGLPRVISISPLCLFLAASGHDLIRWI